MLGFGVWYLGFGTQWIAKYRGAEDSRTAGSTKALITGVQVFSNETLLTVRSDLLRCRWY
jgi:hypothetical protein